MKNDSSDIVWLAEEFARQVHEGQFLRTAMPQPFILHPSKVVALVRESGGTSLEVAAAWLHDVVEDTNVTIEDIAGKFGESIAEIVDGLTDPPHFAGNPPHVRKGWQAERVRDKSSSVKRIKIADQTVNVDLMGNDPPLSYSPEMRLDYVEGAKLIADECAGVSDFLDRKFSEAYAAALKLIKV